MERQAWPGTFASAIFPSYPRTHTHLSPCSETRQYGKTWGMRRRATRAASCLLTALLTGVVPWVTRRICDGVPCRASWRTRRYGTLRLLVNSVCFGVFCHLREERGPGQEVDGRSPSSFRPSVSEPL